jgi:hypothetical protein
MTLQPFAPPETGSGIVPPAGDIGGTVTDPVVETVNGSAAAGHYARGNGTELEMSAIQAADVPTLNQSTTGNAATATTAAACTGNAATATNLAGGATLPAYLAPTVTALTFGASIAVNAALGNVFAVTLTASTGTLANPTNGLDGQVIRVRITQGTGGGFTLAYGSEWDFGAAGAPTLSAAAGDTDILIAEWNAAKSKWCVSAALGY